MVKLSITGFVQFRFVKTYLTYILLNSSGTLGALLGVSGDPVGGLD